MIAPRFAWVPPADESLGDQAIQWWESHGGRLFDWQKMAIRGMLGVSAEGRWVSMEDGLNVARQNGKGVVLQVVEGFCAFELHYPLVTHTAHEFPTCSEHQRRLTQFIQDAPGLHALVKPKGGYVTANGQESIRLRDGCRIIFKARTKNAGRGYTGDLLVWDEAMVIPDEVVSAQFPSTRASQAAMGDKVIYAGSAVDQESMPYGITFARIRERGLAEDPGVSWHEWSAPFEHPDEILDDAWEDREFWHMANPAMSEGLIREERMELELRAMSPRSAAVELLGVGDWPRTDGLQDSVIDVADWDKLENPNTTVDLEWSCLAIDVSPERTTAIALAGKNQHDDWHVEIQEHRQGTRWVVKRVVEMIDNGAPEPVYMDAVGPVASLKLLLEEAGVRVETVTSTEHGAACGRLVDMVTDGTLAHRGSAELRDAVRGAKKRPLGDSWAWSRKNSSVDISPLVAATLALGAAAGIGSRELQVF